MRADGVTWEEIAETLERTVSACSRRHSSAWRRLPAPVRTAFVSMQERDGIRLAEICATVCEVAGITHAQIAASRRAWAELQPRQVYCWLARKFTKASLYQVGRVISRDHTTVCHSINMVDRSPAIYAAMINEVAKRLELTA